MLSGSELIIWDIDQTPDSVLCDLGQNYLPMSHKKDDTERLNSVCPLLTYGMYIKIVFGRKMIMKLIKHVILHKQIRKLIL